MKHTTVLPRDLKPGDKIERLNDAFDVVLVTIKEVKKVRNSGHTSYKVYLEEYADLPDHQKAWRQNRHLAPCIFQPTQKVPVVTEEA
jgi:hypothetical protein